MNRRRECETKPSLRGRKMVAVLKILSVSSLPVAIAALTLSSSSCSYSPFPTKLPISLRSASATRRLPFAALRMDSSATELKPSAVQVSLMSLRPWFSSTGHRCSCSIRFIVSDFSLLLQQDGVLPELMVSKSLFARQLPFFLCLYLDFIIMVVLVFEWFFLQGEVPKDCILLRKMLCL